MKHIGTKTILFLATFQMLGTAINVVTADSEPKTDRAPAISGSDIKEYPGQRNKRAAKLVVSAIDKLLGSASFLLKMAFGEKVYLKTGGYKQALADFRALDPTDVRKLQVYNGLQGKVGDKTVYLTKPSGMAKSPTMTIYGKRMFDFPESIIRYNK